MFEVVVSSSSKSVNKALDEYHDSTSYSDSSSSSSSGNTTDEEYTSGVPRVPLDVFQEHLRMRAASGSRAGTSISIRSSLPLDKVETVYSCAVGIPSKTDERRLATLRSWY